MSIRFKTLLSSSSGNSILLQTDKTNVLIDCGFKSQKACREAIRGSVGDISKIDAVVVTHNHGDHISYSSLKVLEQEQVPVYVFSESSEELGRKHFKGNAFSDLLIEHFEYTRFVIGDLVIEPVEVPHHPDMCTFGFVVRYTEDGREYKILLAADFSDGDALTEHLLDADIIYIEANHDLKLLDANPNYNSYYHMNNPATAKLLADTLPKRKTPPTAVVLGHLSSQRNEPAIAVREIKEAFTRKGQEIAFPLTAAPYYEASEEIAVP